MDVRFAGVSAAASRMALTAPNPDGNPPGSQSQSWNFDHHPQHEKPQDQRAFAWLAEGGAGDAAEAEAYLSAAYQQYDRRGRVEHPLPAGSAAPVATFVLDRTEGARLDIRA